MINLYTTIYKETDRKRNNEFLESLYRNIYCGAIGHIYIFNENNAFKITHPKVTLIDITGRPEYNDFFRYINDHTCDEDINIIANTDIYFDEKISMLETIDLNGRCMALSRWNIEPGGAVRLFNRHDSQDVWIFKGRTRDINGAFDLGVPRCDNRLLYELERAGYKVLNPSLSIKVYHVHAGERNDYSIENEPHFIEPPYAYLWPHNMYSLPGTIIYNIKNPGKFIKYHINIARMLHFRPIRVVLEPVKDLLRRVLGKDSD